MMFGGDGGIELYTQNKLLFSSRTKRLKVSPRSLKLLNISKLAHPGESNTAPPSAIEVAIDAAFFIDLTTST